MLPNDAAELESSWGLKGGSEGLKDGFEGWVPRDMLKGRFQGWA